MMKGKQNQWTKKFLTAYIMGGLTLLIAIGLHWLFIIPTAIYFYIAFLIFKNIKNTQDIQEDSNSLEKEQTNIVQTNTEEIKMGMSNEELEVSMEALGRDEDVTLFLRVTQGQVKYTALGKLREEYELMQKKAPEGKAASEEIQKPKKPTVTDNESESDEVIEG